MASADDKFLLVGQPGTATNLSSPGYNQGDTSITVEATTNFPTTTGVIFAIDVAETVDGKEKRVDGSLSVFAGLVSGANTITDLELLAGTPQDYTPGAQTRVYITVSSMHNERLIGGILDHANQDGSLKPAAVQAALNLGAGDLNGWNALGFAPNAVVHNGNRSYSLTFNGQDLTGTLSRGTRLRTTRTTPAPNQCTSLNGTNQFWSKSSPNGMTFTDDFACGAWVYLNTYSTSDTIIGGRYNGTSGYRLGVTPFGQPFLVGFNAGSANFRAVLSYQTIPLKRWVYVSAQLDMSAHAVGTTTSYVMLDGVDTPAFVTQGGTNPTALVQAGDFQVGASNSAAFFPGKIAQFSVFNAKVTQANFRSYMNQGMVGNEANLVSCYSFNGTANDLNANANNLTANNAATATNAGSPFGGQASDLISTTLDYAIVSEVTFSVNTTVVVHVAEGCTIPTIGDVANVAYSPSGNPYGFPGNRAKWTISALFVASPTSIPIGSVGAWFVASSHVLKIPIGDFKHGYSGTMRFDSTVNGVRSGFVTMAAAQPTASVYSYEMTSRLASAGTNFVIGSCNRDSRTNTFFAAETAMSLYAAIDSATGTETWRPAGEQGTVVMYAENAYI